jgi:3-oxoacyl-[acyl-carrier protein] reductase
MPTLAGKVAIVTGASRGIGRAIAERLAQDGANVVINYAHSADKVQEVVSAIKAKGGQALAVQAHMGQVTDVRRLFQETIDRFGQLDILINNAGNVPFKPLVEVTEEEFDKLFALNAKGPFFAMQEAARRMSEGGRIVNISSGITGYALPGSSVYAGSKGALEQFTRAAAKELGARGITVNAVSPGSTNTQNFQNSSPEMQQQAIQSSPLGRVGEPEDIADVVAFVVSEQARWLTGQNIRATGGAV